MCRKLLIIIAVTGSILEFKDENLGLSRLNNILIMQCRLPNVIFRLSGLLDILNFFFFVTLGFELPALHLLCHLSQLGLCHIYSYPSPAKQPLDSYHSDFSDSL